MQLYDLIARQIINVAYYLKMENSSVRAVVGECSKAQDTEPVKIWCLHYECFKYLDVCNRCRVRIKCQSYQDYWFPRFDFCM